MSEFARTTGRVSSALRGKAVKASVVLMMAAMSTAAFADPAVWTGATSTAWSDGTNWDIGAAPGSTSSTTNTDTATFGATSANTAIVVDSNRNIQSILISATTSGYSFSGGPLLLTSGGSITATNVAQSSTFSAPLQVQGNAATYTIEADMPGTNRLMTISGGITGASAAGTTTVTLTGVSGGANIVSSVIGDGSAGGNVALTKTGTGLWVLSGANTYTGGTTVGGGVLRLSGSGNISGLIGTGLVTLSGGGQLRAQSTSSVTFNDALATGTGGGSISARASLTFSPTSLTGTGTLTFTSDNNGTITPTTFAGYAGSVAFVAPAAGVTNIRQATAYIGNSLINATVDVGVGVNFTRQAGTNGTATTDIGTLTGAGGAIGGSGGGTGTFFYSVGSRNENSTYFGVFLDGGTKTGLVKVGTATLTLAGVNTYTGTTTVNGGTLAITGSLGTSLVTVASAGTIGGTGTIGGLITNNGSIAPGAAGVAGKLTASGGAVLSSASSLGFLLDMAGAAGGTGGDSLLSTTALTLNTGVAVNVTAGVDFTAGTYHLIDYTGLTDNSGGFGGWVANLPTGFTGTFALGTDNGVSSVDLIVSGGAAVPEPASVGVLVVGAMGLLARRRRA